MAEILYADYKRNTERLAKVLSNEGMDVECIGNRNEGEKLVMADRLFYRDYFDKLHQYKLLIAHLGTNFGSQVHEVLHEYPHVRVILVSNLSEHYLRNEDRVLVCGYNANELLEFAKKALQK